MPVRPTNSMKGTTMNIVRLGHYFTPSGIDDGNMAEGSCRTALVVDVLDTTERQDQMVGLVIWNHNGGMEVRHEVRVSHPLIDEDTFHLSGDCPFHR